MDLLVAGYNFELNSHSAFSAAPGHTGAEFQWKSSGALVTVQSKFARLHVPDTLADCETVRASKILPQSRARARIPALGIQELSCFSCSLLSRACFLPRLVQTPSGKRRNRNTDLPSAAKTNTRTKLRKHCFRLPSRHWPNLPDTGQSVQEY